MLPYIRTYLNACFLAQRHLRKFEVSRLRRFKSAVKSGNLAICFLGFSIYGGKDAFRRSAELGTLASLFDLVSDILKYDPAGLHLFKQLTYASLDRLTADILLDLMNRKKSRRLRLAGLERGVDAFRVIIMHLNAQNAWPDHTDITSTGILLQVVDDLLDYRHDLQHQELNFLTGEKFGYHLEELVAWDYKKQFHASRYPLVLFYVIKRAKLTAAKILNATRPQSAQA